eukprot:6322695-Amphidinium_carterae.1
MELFFVTHSPETPASQLVQNHTEESQSQESEIPSFAVSWRKAAQVVLGKLSAADLPETQKSSLAMRQTPSQKMCCYVRNQRIARALSERGRQPQEQQRTEMAEGNTKF